MVGEGSAIRVATTGECAKMAELIGRQVQAWGELANLASELQAGKSLTNMAAAFYELSKQLAAAAAGLAKKPDEIAHYLKIGLVVVGAFGGAWLLSKVILQKRAAAA